MRRIGLFIIALVVAWIPPASAQPAVVEAVKVRLEAQGIDLSGSCGAFRIVKHVAWELASQGYGLVSKPYGEQCDGYKTDAIAFIRSNQLGVVDILIDAGGANGPIWQVEWPTQNLAIRWAMPIDPGGGTAPPPPAPPASQPIPSTDLTPILLQLQNLQVYLDGQHQVLRDQIMHLQQTEDAWHATVTKEYESKFVKVFDFVTRYILPAVTGWLIASQ